MEKFMIPGAGGILERSVGGVKYILLQERHKKEAPMEEGLIEIPAGKIREFESIYDCLRREIKEETGLDVVHIEGEEDSIIYESNGYKVISYEPFASSQNIEGTYPIMVQTFICQVQGELVPGTNETRSLRWVSIDELKELLESRPGRFYPMHVNTLRKYIGMNVKTAALTLWRCRMAKYETVITGDFKTVVEHLDNDIMKSGLTMNLVDESNYTIGDTQIAVRVYDKYFMRNSSRASLSLTVAGHGDKLFISAIGAGGGQGVFFNFSLGAESELIEVVEASLRRYGK